MATELSELPGRKKSAGEFETPRRLRLKSWLERQAQRELDVAALVGRGTLSALGSLHERCRHRTHVKIAAYDELVVVIHDVVKLATELQAKAFRNLELLDDVHVEIPEAWT